MSEARTASLERQTSESKVSISLNLDGTGRAQISTGVGFFDHMLTAFAKHSLIDLEVESAVTHIDAHHRSRTPRSCSARPSVRHCDKRGIRRFGTHWCRWTRRWPRRWLMSPGDPTASTRGSRLGRSMC